MRVVIYAVKMGRKPCRKCVNKKEALEMNSNILMGAIVLSLLAFMTGRFSKDVGAKVPVAMQDMGDEVEPPTVKAVTAAQKIKKDPSSYSAGEKALLEMVKPACESSSYDVGKIPDAVWAKESQQIYDQAGIDQPYEYTEAEQRVDAALIAPNF